MSKIRSGPVFPAKQLSEEERQALREELAWLEKDLVRRRDKLRYWTARKADAETLPHISEHLKSETLFFYEQAKELVETGTRLRAFLLSELQAQPEHAPAYHEIQ